MKFSAFHKAGSEASYRPMASVPFLVFVPIHLGAQSTTTSYIQSEMETGRLNGSARRAASLSSLAGLTSRLEYQTGIGSAHFLTEANSSETEETV